MIFLNVGHAHLTDFNVAAYVNNEGTSENLLRNLAGTKPYMAPEIYKVCTYTRVMHLGNMKYPSVPCMHVLNL